jgi:hypothetical protein
MVQLEDIQADDPQNLVIEVIHPRMKLFFDWSGGAIDFIKR